MTNTITCNFRISSDFYYQRNVILGNHLRNKTAKFPWHGSVTESLDLELFIDPDPRTAYSEGFLVHPTDELPKISRDEVFVFDGGQELEVLITPSVIKSDDSLQSLELSDRSCYFKGERKLRFFNVYTKRNCETECFSKHFLEACNCVPFHVVRDSHARVCGFLQDGECVMDVESEFTDDPTIKVTSCSCLPTCESITYNIEVRGSKLRKDEK